MLLNILCLQTLRSPRHSYCNLTEAMSVTLRDDSSASDSVVIDVESEQNALKALVPTASPQQSSLYLGRVDRSLKACDEDHSDFQSKCSGAEFLEMDKAFGYAGSLHAQSSERNLGLPRTTVPSSSTYLINSSHPWHSRDGTDPIRFIEGDLDVSSGSAMASGNAWSMPNGSSCFSHLNYSICDLPETSESPVSWETTYMQTDCGAPPTATTMDSLIGHKRSTGFENSIAYSVVDSGYDSLSNKSTPNPTPVLREYQAFTSPRYDLMGEKRRRLNAVNDADYADICTVVEGWVSQDFAFPTIPDMTFPAQPITTSDHLATMTQETSLEKLPDTIGHQELEFEQIDTEEEVLSIPDVYPYQRVHTGVTHVSNYLEEMTTTEADPEDCDDNGPESSDDSEDFDTYSAASRYFGLLASPRQSQCPETRDSSDGTHDTSSTRGSISPILSYTNSLRSFGSGSSSITDTNSSNCQKSLSDGSVAVAFNRTRGISGQKPLELLCWHAAIGLKCKGAVGRNTSARRLYM
jgi:hypothetical protein